MPPLGTFVARPGPRVSPDCASSEPLPSRLPLRCPVLRLRVASGVSLEQRHLRRLPSSVLALPRQSRPLRPDPSASPARAFSQRLVHRHRLSRALKLFGAESGPRLAGPCRLPHREAAEPRFPLRPVPPSLGLNPDSAERVSPWARRQRRFRLEPTLGSARHLLIPPSPASRSTGWRPLPAPLARAVQPWPQRRTPEPRAECRPVPAPLGSLSHRHVLLRREMRLWRGRSSRTVFPAQARPSPSLAPVAPSLTSSFERPSAGIGNVQPWVLSRAKFGTTRQDRPALPVGSAALSGQVVSQPLHATTRGWAGSRPSWMLPAAARQNACGRFHGSASLCRS